MLSNFTQLAPRRVSTVWVCWRSVWDKTIIEVAHIRTICKQLSVFMCYRFISESWDQVEKGVNQIWSKYSQVGSIKSSNIWPQITIATALRSIHHQLDNGNLTAEWSYNLPINRYLGFMQWVLWSLSWAWDPIAGIFNWWVWWIQCMGGGLPACFCGGLLWGHLV